jgi:hypothetical protein
MSGTSSSLLDAMKVRLSMIESGMISPNPLVATATRQLIERLSELPPDEKIQVSYTTNPLHVQYFRHSTGEVIAEFRMPENT